MSQVPYPQNPGAAPQFAGQYPQQPQYPQQYAPQATPASMPLIPTYEVQNKEMFEGGHNPVADANLRGGLHTRIAAPGVDVEFPAKNSMIVRFLPGICLGGGKLLAYRSPAGTFDGEYNGMQDCWYRKYPLWRGGHNRPIAMLCPDMAENNRESPIALLTNAAFQSKRGSADPAWQHLLTGAPGRGADLSSADNYALVRALVYQRNPAQGDAAQYDPPRGIERPLLLAIRSSTFEDFESWAGTNPQADPVSLDAGVFWNISIGAGGGAVQLVSGGQPQSRGTGKPFSERYRMTPSGLTHAVTQQQVSPSLTQRGDEFMRQLFAVMLPWDRLLAPPTVEEQVIELIQAFPTALCEYAWSGHPEWLALPEVRQRIAQPLLMKQSQAPVQVSTGQAPNGPYNPYQLPAGYQPPGGGYMIPPPGPQMQPQQNFAMPQGYPSAAGSFVAAPPAPQQPQYAPPQQPQQPQSPQGYPQPQYMAPPPGVQMQPPQTFALPQQAQPQPQPQQPPAFLAPPPGVQTQMPQQYAPQGYPQQPQVPQQPAGPMGTHHDAGVTAMFAQPTAPAQPPLQNAADALAAYMPRS